MKYDEIRASNLSVTDRDNLWKLVYSRFLDTGLRWYDASSPQLAGDIHENVTEQIIYPGYTGTK